MLSSTYQMSCDTTTRTRPRWTRRTCCSGGASRRRLEAEAIRDAVTA